MRPELHPQAVQHLRIGHGAPDAVALSQRGSERLGRQELHRARQGIGAVDRLHLDELARGSVGRAGHGPERVHRADAARRGKGLLLLRTRRAIEKADLDIPTQELAGIARQAGAHCLRHGADAGDQGGAEGETEKEQAESRDAAAQLAPRQPPGQR